MLVHLNYNIDPILTDAGYIHAEDNGYFKLFTNRDVKLWNIKRNFNLRKSGIDMKRAARSWRFHAIPLSDFSFNLHVDFGKTYGHGYINDHSILNIEITRIKKVSLIK